MKREYILFLVLAVTPACSREDSQSSTMPISDSIRLISTHKDLEKVISDYYRSIEEDIKMDLGVSEAEIIERVESLINDGYVKKPAIFFITKDGPKWETVDYATYKKFMTKHAMASRRYHGIQPDILDSLFIDSIRSNLLKALKGDSAHFELR